MARPSLARPSAAPRLWPGLRSGSLCNWPGHQRPGLSSGSHSSGSLRFLFFAGARRAFTTLPSRVSAQPMMMSSSQSGAKLPSSAVMSGKRFFKLRANKELESAAMREGQLRWPTILTPFFVVTISPALAPSTLPPRSTAKSISTLPGFIEATIFLVIKIGAARPGISAVVITMSCLAT